MMHPEFVPRAKLWEDGVQVQSFDEFPTASHADLLEDIGEVILDRVLGDVELLGDQPGGGAMDDQLDDFLFMTAELIAECGQPEYFLGSGWCDDHHRLGWPDGGRLGA